MPQQEVMTKDSVVNVVSIKEWLSHAQGLVQNALAKAAEVKTFQNRWKMIISRLEHIPSRLSDLSSHPCFSKNALCIEQLQAISKALNDVTELADLCVKEKYEGKLRMQNDLDALVAKLDLNLRDCGLLIKTGVLGEVTLTPIGASTSNHINVKELLARLQIGDLEAKHNALDRVMEIMNEDKTTILPILGRSNVAALVQLLVASTSPKIREKTVTIICSLSELGNFERWVVSGGALPPLIRLLESGSAVSKEKATIALQRLSTSSEAARLIVGHGGVRPLIEICRTGDSVSQASASCTLRNISAVPEAQLPLSEEGIVKAMISVLDNGILLRSKEYASECLQNLTSCNNDLKTSIVSEGGVRSLLAYLDSPAPQEPTISALRNVVSMVPLDVLLSLGLLPRLVHVLKSGSIEVQNAAVSIICRICMSIEAKHSIGESGCIPLLVKMLESKRNDAREVAAQAISMLITVSSNCQKVKKVSNSVPNLVALLDPGIHNTAKKYAVVCLMQLVSSKKCKTLMVSYGAIGYLKKLVEMDIPGAKTLMKQLERGTLKSLFSRK